MEVRRGRAAWAKRTVLAAVLVAAAVIPGRAASQGSQHCLGVRCSAPGSVLWTRALPGSWLAQPGVAGTNNSLGGAYAATGGGVAVVGFGVTVAAYQASTGKPLWLVSLTAVPRGSAIVGVRAFPGVVAVGVLVPGSAPGSRDELILSDRSGRQVRTFQAASYGGAVAADLSGTVVVGTRTVTDYADRTGRVLWRHTTGAANDAWRVCGHFIYLAQARGGGASALIRINLKTGVERILRPRHGFSGSLSGAVDGTVLFTAASGVWAYSGQTGRLLWQRTGAVLGLTDTRTDGVYLTSGNSLTAVAAQSGIVIAQAAASVSASLYSVTGGVALGLDQGSLGEAWGYDIASRRVIWTSTPLPWPHFFVDLSGLGGSVSAGSDVAVIATCRRVGRPAAAGSAPSCLRPELAAVVL